MGIFRGEIALIRNFPDEQIEKKEWNIGMKLLRVAPSYRSLSAGRGYESENTGET
jgi:hypothetical protein